MARYRKVSVKIWNDRKFMSLSPNAQLVFLFILTHPNMTGLGVMRATMEGLCAEQNLPQKAFREGFEEAFAKGLIGYSRESLCVTLPKFLKHNKPESPNVVRGFAKNMDILPECDLTNQAILSLKQVCETLGEGFAKAFREAFAKDMPNPEPEPEPDKDKYPIGYSSTEQVQPPPASKKCPHMKIVEEYNRILGDHHLTRVKEKLWNGTRKKNLAARWKEDPERQSIDWWRRYFETVRGSPWLIGENDSGWTADLGWLVKPANMAKVLEGKYGAVLVDKERASTDKPFDPEQFRAYTRERIRILQEDGREARDRFDLETNNGRDYVPPTTSA